MSFFAKRRDTLELTATNCRIRIEWLLLKKMKKQPKDIEELVL